MTETSSKIIKLIEGISHGQQLTTIFFDWVTMAALSVSNSTEMLKNKIWKDREERYLSIAKKYKEKELKELCKATGYLMQAFEEELFDYLGEIYHGLNANNRKTGQFFTPYHLSLLNARIATDKNAEEFKINEPSCGSGGMVIATAQALKDNGMDYIKLMKVSCTDIDINCVYMCYLQLSLAGIKAKVTRKDALINSVPENSEIYCTPAWKMFT